jgi:hypothetical protein
MAMMTREPGYYWVTWTERADEDLTRRRPAPLVAQWDGNVWWLVRSDVYRFDCELKVLGGMLRQSPPDYLRPVPESLQIAKA